MVPGSKRTQNDLGTNFHFCKVGEGTISSWNQPVKPDLHQNSHRGGPSKTPRAPWELALDPKNRVFTPTSDHPTPPPPPNPSSTQFTKTTFATINLKNSMLGPNLTCQPNRTYPRKTQNPFTPQRPFAHAIWKDLLAEFKGMGCEFWNLDLIKC